MCLAFPFGSTADRWHGFAHSIPVLLHRTVFGVASCVRSRPHFLQSLSSGGVADDDLEKVVLAAVGAEYRAELGRMAVPAHWIA